MKKYIAELTGTYILVFCGTGAIVIDAQTKGGVTHIGIAMAFGLSVMSLIYAFGDISGAHFNPAVSIAFTIARRFKAGQLLPYIVSQLTGALLASLTLKVLFPADRLLGATVPAGSVMQSLILEALLTFILMVVILRVSTGNKEQGIMAGIAIGAVILIEAAFAGPISGASMNPARSVAPALVSGCVMHLWVYIAGPIVGACLAVPVCGYLRER